MNEQPGIFEQKTPSLRYSWYVVGLLTLANISSFLDRQILALLVAPIKRDLHLSDTEVSLLMGLSFAMFYTVFGIVIGRLADRANRRNIIITGIALWSLLTALCAGVKTYSQFFFARMGVGVGEATLSPSAYSIITDYFPRRKLAVAMSVFTMGIFLGSGLALAIGAALVAKLPTTGMLDVPVLGSIYPWQKLFLMIGLPGLIISLLVFTIREPIRKDVMKKDGGRTRLSLRESLRIVFQHPKTFLSICVGTAFTAFASYGTTAWVPTYFNRTFGWAVPKAGLSFGLVLLAASVSGILWGGWYADRLIKKGIQNGRIRVGIIAAAGILVSFFIPLVSSPNLVLVLLFVPAFFMASPMGASATAVQELMPNQVRALSSAIFLFSINMIGLGLGPYLVAFFTDSVFKDEMAIRFSLVALFIVGGSVSLLFYLLGYNDYNKIMEQRRETERIPVNGG
ncbi:Sugar phosphate permease [Chryseolinea serpens]|uniref:Sugar phosphate permease n=1 Tax=Chryseolinea serpens TaxID=947013 RepID=A0A1M5TCK1_9BACT|nr:MFS transporter [Chryseolinea serpens]SHH48497.1 Sugar phosphate permease [Chryseolinea serpens]